MGRNFLKEDVSLPPMNINIYNERDMYKHKRYNLGLK
nr:MAG TPA: hypothetical protein [Bacteriophage sp.]